MHSICLKLKVIQAETLNFFSVNLSFVRGPFIEGVFPSHIYSFSCELSKPCSLHVFLPCLCCAEAEKVRSHL